MSKFLLTIFFVIAFASSAFADSCQRGSPIYQEFERYYKSAEFLNQLSNVIAKQTGYAVKKIKIYEPDFAGESHSGLLRTLIPQGLTLLGDDTDAYLDQYFRTDNGDIMDLVLEGVSNVWAGLRVDNWVLCKENQVVQPFVKVEGFLKANSKVFKIDMVWDLKRKEVVAAAANPVSLVKCSLEDDDEKFDSLEGTMSIRQTETKGTYIADFDLGENGTFTLSTCTLETQYSMICEGPGIYSGKIAWMGLVPASPDSVKIELNARIAERQSVNVPAASKRYKCR